MSAATYEIGPTGAVTRFRVTGKFDARLKSQSGGVPAPSPGETRVPPSFPIPLPTSHYLVLPARAWAGVVPYSGVVVTQTASHANGRTPKAPEIRQKVGSLKNNCLILQTFLRNLFWLSQKNILLVSVITESSHSKIESRKNYCGALNTLISSGRE